MQNTMLVARPTQNRVQYIRASPSDPAAFFALLSKSLLSFLKLFRNSPPSKPFDLSFFEPLTVELDPDLDAELAFFDEDFAHADPL